MSSTQSPPGAPPKQAGLGSNYYKLWTASAISNLGDGVRLTAMPLLAATLTREPTLVAGVTLASSLPWLLFALIAGAVVDRVDRRGLMWSMQILRMVIMGVLSLAIVLGWADVPLLILLYVLSFLLGIGETLFDNAAQSIMPTVVPKPYLQRANGRLFAVEQVTNQFAGPPIGSFLFVAAAAAPFMLDAVSFGVAAALIFAISGTHRPVRSGAAPTRIRADIVEGLKWLWSHRLLRTLAIMTGLFNLTSSAVFSVFVLYVLEILRLSESAYGVIIALGAVGGVLGGVLGERIARLLGDGPSLQTVSLTSAATAIAVAVTSSVVAVVASIVIASLGAMVWNVIAVSLRQQIVPDTLMGRVNSVYRLLAWGTMPLGAAAGGLLSDAFGLNAPWFFMAAVLIVMAGFGARVVNNRTISAARAEAATD